MNKIIRLTIILALFSCFGCASINKEDGSNSISTQETTPNKTGATLNTFSVNSCPEDKITIPNYGDPAHRLKSCFVEYPGEQSRQDKHYYIVEDICGQFTKEFMENVIGQKIAKIESPKVSTLYNCSYYLDEKRYIMLNLEYLNAQKQKTGKEAMGRKVEQSSKIPMENLVVYQEDGPINVIYLILGPEKFLSLRPSAADVFTNDQFIQLAGNLANDIKGYR